MNGFVVDWRRRVCLQVRWVGRRRSRPAHRTKERRVLEGVDHVGFCILCLCGGLVSGGWARD